ncbi:isomultiflorenol synthase-like [Rhododendron vialii]|uniref:isomultiflorenol synthase-like n=1 Tax=Rhododendron vialii TaxID=182163 RepID=UPI00265E1776|nr:isomultiflorenol synthase-like [Rhododendron vialii]
MWRLKITEGDGPHMFSTNNFVGRQFWEFEPDAGMPEERAEVEQAQEYYKKNNRRGPTGRPWPSSDLLMRMQWSSKQKYNFKHGLEDATKQLSVERFAGDIRTVYLSNQWSGLKTNSFNPDC